MPFGRNCEHPNFDSCVRTMTGKVDKPLAFCASLMRATEEKCRQRSRRELKKYWDKNFPMNDVVGPTDWIGKLCRLHMRKLKERLRHDAR